MAKRKDLDVQACLRSSLPVFPALLFHVQILAYRGKTEEKAEEGGAPSPQPAFLAKLSSRDIEGLRSLQLPFGIPVAICGWRVGGSRRVSDMDVRAQVLRDGASKSGRLSGRRCGGFGKAGTILADIRKQVHI